MKLGILTSHPIQYQAPLFRELARQVDLTVYFAHRQTPEAQAEAGFGVAFEWDVDLLSGYQYEFLENVAQSPDTGRFFGCDTPSVRQRIAEGGFDAFLVMGWHLKCFWQAVFACQRAGVPVMVRGDSQLGTPRGRFKQALKRLLYPWILRQFDGLLYVGQRNREYLEHYGARADQLFFAPHCVDNNFFAARAAEDDPVARRQSWGVQPSDRAVLFAGKLVERKRPADLVRALASLRAPGQPVIGVFAGDGPLRDVLTSLGQELQVPLIFLGFCNQMALPGIYAAADLLVLPSEGSETWGLVVNEAQACGTPCVVSDACGCAPDLASMAGVGLHYPVGQVAVMADVIHGLLKDVVSRPSAAVLRHIAHYDTLETARGVQLAAKALGQSAT